MGDVAYDTVLRYAINTTFSLVAGYFGLNATQEATGENVMFAAVSATIVAAAWGWGIYRSRPTQKIADVAAIPGTQVVTTDILAKAVPSKDVVSNLDNKVVSK